MTKTLGEFMYNTCKYVLIALIYNSPTTHQKNRQGATLTQSRKKKDKQTIYIWYIFSLFNMTSMKNIDNTQCWPNCRKLGPIISAGMSLKWCRLFGE